jgi:HSP20 family protein
MSERKDMQVYGKQGVQAATEQTKPGLVFTPEVDIFETEEAITLLVDMPGVVSDTLAIDLRENVLTLTGEVQPIMGEKEKPVLIEFDTGTLYRQFTLAETIDQERIQAKLEGGVLRLVMPKAEKARPRKIAIQTA